jgi:carbamoyltransferase
MDSDYVLGLGYTIHDASACLMRRGEIVAAIARERLTRIKHDGGGWDRAKWGHSWDLSPCIDYCLQVAGISIDDVALVVQSHIANPPPDEFVQKFVSAFEIPYPAARAVMIPHHLAHAYSAYYASGFSDAAVMVVDGNGSTLGAILGYAGEDAEGMRRIGYDDATLARSEKLSLYSVVDGEFDLLRKDFTPGSIGLAYQAVTFLIFGRKTDPGKTMGLAPYGVAKDWDDLIVSEHGRVSYPYRAALTDQDFPEPASQWPASREAWSADHHLFADLAAKVQADTERVLLDIARTLRETTGHRRLCVAGGVALNSVANKRILDECGFDEVFFMPAAGDDGIGIGCAYWGTHSPHALRRPGARRMITSASLGRDYPAGEVEAVLNADRRNHHRQLPESELLKRAVDTLACGGILGWFWGGSEVGPRALGHRSILADPRAPEMQKTLNERVKFREAFRPFAPAVLLERVADYFDFDRPSPHMLLVAQVRRDKQALLPAITHIDGSARLQTVTESANGRFYRLIKAFGERTGVPVLVNTSFNIRGEPIVESPYDALQCFHRGGIDALVVDDFWIERRELNRDEFLANHVRLNPNALVVIEQRFEGDARKRTARVRLQNNAEYRFEVKPEAADVLCSADARATVADLVAALLRTEVYRTESEAIDWLLRALSAGLILV